MRFADGFGLLHRELRIAEQLFRVLPCMHQSDTDGAFDPDFELRKLERSSHDLLDPLGSLQRIFDATA